VRRLPGASGERGRGLVRRVLRGGDTSCGSHACGGMPTRARGAGSDGPWRGGTSRRATGVTAGHDAPSASTQVEVVAGRDSLATHASSPGVVRSFCSECGTKLFFNAERWPGETHVVLAAFDDPLDRAPSGHAFWNEHASWLPPLASPPA